MTEKQARKLEAYIMAVVSSIPIETIYSDYSGDPRSFVLPDKNQEDILLEHLHLLYSALAVDGTKINTKAFKAIADSTRLFAGSEELVTGFIEEVFHVKKN